ncbi:MULTISPECIES: glutamine amidotransferase family protein [unclassified Mesorhizobium]|uniref:class II glutamine amidotransferase n=1 Tax=unclassified Mesorhizobium TaxID=325217 RepID=UPI000F74D6D3|nr:MULTISPECIES: glutamine amidotransferase family protein [unclassified Mesorhizobium]AZO05833.1 glutamine amidotransferase [Mesorhizobium sp. M2A.F.Ca.ET.043.02.1.1]RUW41550.1 glutamine amidotransferase [Mesorhizobium sp. M2A.F.Ca.ET.015.02.1.1]RUW76026.1 glutamine amidotransferase [Mesorhizobium sp. M2A.F.Ca.ET.067.02.1.1]RVC93723.1 glutamine amidotransferase [Mesorhizobium sp. M2A.F.Ca.ET.017.03.2.1]RVC94767.1 glutamine amidotransferase [Mesorhizobium sp. M2A.F.Ca.ET.029.05.1.1]
MCGIVGLFLKDKALEPKLGAMLSEMLVSLSDRGPDSAGIAIYGAATGNEAKVTVQSPKADRDFRGLDAELAKAIGAPVSVAVNSTHAVIRTTPDKVDAAREALQTLRPDIRIMGAGEAVEIYKEVGLPETVIDRFHVRSMSGTHGIGHTRMATESAVTTMGAHPFSTGADQCLVHNGSLSNHNNVRRELIRDGMKFETENDTEVAAAYLSNRMAHGKNLGEALEGTLSDLDGFFTFVVGTKNGFGVVRDPIACKPAVMAETDQYVAFGSEYRALTKLPGIDNARVWEPEPATVYFWEH